MRKKTAAVPCSYTWDAKKTPAAIDSALRTLSKRYPALNPKRGNIRLVFTDNRNPSECSAAANGNIVTIASGKTNMAIRMVGAVLSGAVPKKADYCPFEMFGVMIDCSRNAVMTVDYMKSWLDRLAILGYNMAMLYTEETYQIEGEPFFGAMRGAYTPAEIREIDDYAAQLGIELIPCIQTLAHLEQMFRWSKYNEVNDIYGILLVDEQKTYDLIEKMIITWKENVRSRRIHVGMDEAHGVGEGKFKKLHGEESRFNIINRHLKKVVDICGRHGFKPMMWSDMFFRIGSKNMDYYDKECVIPEEVAKDIPKEVELVYWDYYHEEKDFYTDWIARHRALGGEPLMGSGIWTWNKFWYDHYYTEQTVVPCIAACREAKVKDVFFTMWGDDGGFCDYDSAFTGLAFASELAFTGETDSKSIDRKLHALFNGSSYSDLLELAKCCYANFPPMLWDDPLMMLYIGSFINAKDDAVTYTKKYSSKVVMRELRLAAKHLAKAPKCGDAGNIPYARAFADMILAKLTYVDEYLKAYAKRDRKKAVAKVLPLLQDYRKKLKRFIAEFRAMWFRHNKPFGLESIQIRLAGQLARTDEAVIRLTEFVEGSEEKMPETEDFLRIKDELKMPWASWARVSHGTTII